jgi:transposase-like protein
VTDRAAAEEALELAVRVGVNRAEEFGVNQATLYNAWRQWGAGAADRPAGGCPAGLWAVAGRVPAAGSGTSVAAGPLDLAAAGDPVF